MNHLYYGDNLTVLRDRTEFPDECVDLILDPPFNSKRDDNLLFKSPKGHASEAQVGAFEDTWHWNEPSRPRRRTRSSDQDELPLSRS
jgi:site-specific DNA-methyltransferase (adenine-specific)